MKLIMKTEFDNLRLNPKHTYEADNNGNKQVIKIYRLNELIAKKVTQKKSIRYFGIKGYNHYLMNEDI